MQRKVAGSLKVDDGTGVFDCTVGGPAPGVDADTVGPGAFVLLIGKLQCRHEGGGNRFNIKAHKVGADVGAGVWVLLGAECSSTHLADDSSPARTVLRPPMLPPSHPASSST